MAAVRTHRYGVDPAGLEQLLGRRSTLIDAIRAVLLTASPLGTALGGPLTTALGPRVTLGGSGLATVALGAVACVLLLVRRKNR